jgi:YebC/PmpR family DNA-binding regulatory protein
MPKENIERGIKKGTGELEGVEYTEVLYEAYGPGGVALMIQALTDNATRTVADVRHKLSRNGGNLGAANSVSYLFDRKGQMALDAAGRDEDTVMMAALEAGAEDVALDGDEYTITTAPADLHAVREAMEKAGYPVRDATLSWIPRTTVKVEGDNAPALLKLLDALEDLDDVQKVDANFEMDDDAMAAA